jgi:outer membrane biosynthesis protein TonB
LKLPPPPCAVLLVSYDKQDQQERQNQYNRSTGTEIAITRKNNNGSKDNDRGTDATSFHHRRHHRHEHQPQHQQQQEEGEEQEEEEDEDEDEEERKNNIKNNKQKHKNMMNDKSKTNEKNEMNKKNKTNKRKKKKRHTGKQANRHAGTHFVTAVSRGFSSGIFRYAEQNGAKSVQVCPSAVELGEAFMPFY